MSNVSAPWPLPGQIDPRLTPCAFCRRRITVSGKQVFATCSCKAFGPSVTMVALVAGAALALGVGAWWLATAGAAANEPA